MRYVLAKQGAYAQAPAVQQLLAQELALGLNDPATYEAFRQRCERSREALVGLVRRLRAEGKRVVGYAATDGLEWETPDRHTEEIGAAGGLDVWFANFDADPQQWAFRTRLALYEIEAINRWR